jgi:7-cyano-7-deazaguanine synthase
LGTRVKTDALTLVPSAQCPMPSPAIILLSGGLDSAVTLACAVRDGFAVHALSIDYGQRHRHELVASAAVAKQVGAVSHKIIPLDLRAIGGSALTSDTMQVPKGRDVHDVASLEEAVPITYVPARNLTFLSLALGYGEVVGARDIYIGVNAVDYSGYPDCRPAFIESFERTANLATKLGTESASKHEQGIRLHTPIINLTKAAIVRLGVELGVDFSLTHSCYDPVVTGRIVFACGRCDSCIIRREGFANAGVSDPTRYA